MRPLLTLCFALLCMAGCRTRTIEVTSQPAGALVWLNDEQVGRTPLEADFTHYGTHDVRLRLDGFTPVSTVRSAGAPLVDQPGIDLITQAFPGRSVTRWHFILEPLPELTDQQGAEHALVKRAQQVRDKVAPQPSGPAGTPTTVTPSATSPSTTAPAPTTAK